MYFTCYLTDAPLTISSLAAGEYLLRAQRTASFAPTGDWFETSFPAECVSDFIPFTIPQFPTPCSTVTGKVFVDSNSNCFQNYPEAAVPNVIAEILPGPRYVTTDNSGTYTTALPPGNYTITEQSDLLTQTCTGGAASFTLTTSSTTTIRNVPTNSAVPLDVAISLASGLARPGFPLQYGMTVKNHTPAHSGNLTITMELDPVLIYVSSTPAPVSIANNMITWNLNSGFALGAFMQRAIHLECSVPPDVSLLGTDLVTTVSVSSVNVDGNLTNNSATNIRMITGSYDPNDKIAYTSTGSTTAFEPDVDEWIDYTIRFQNTGTDTAFHVIITDTLTSDLDPGSIQIGAASHPFTWQLRDQGTLKFYLLNILLPDSNVNEPESHGFVSFRIRPRDPQDLLPGDQITNVANIFFDFNEPVITDPSILNVTMSTGLDSDGVHDGMKIYPQPNNGSFTIIGNTEGQFTSIQVFSVDGRELIRDRVATDQRQFQLNGLANGRYVVRLIGDDLIETYSIPLLIQR